VASALRQALTEYRSGRERLQDLADTVADCARSLAVCNDVVADRLRIISMRLNVRASLGDTDHRRSTAVAGLIDTVRLIAEAIDGA
jgi:hypothetical protein